MRHRRHLIAGSAAAVALLAGALFGGLLAESPSAGSTAVEPPQAISESALSGIAQGGAQTTVASLESALASSPGDPDVLGSLGLAYQIRWRETADPVPPSHQLWPRVPTIRQRRSVSAIWRSSSMSSSGRSSSAKRPSGSRRTRPDLTV